MRKTSTKLVCAVMLALTACSPGGQGAPDGTVFAPDVDPRGTAVDGLIVGHRLMEARQPELALEAYTRAAANEGLTADVLSSIGSANLALGRLNQAERHLRRASELEPEWPEIWNNLGVILMERGKPAEAEHMFRKAFALDNGESDSIRENLKLALQKRDDIAYADDAEQDYKLVRRGSGDFLIVTTGD